ncbi:hypothetical protein [Natrinema halophilum]|uniref:Uncharacterized protein n=1 Tax=Natrinema halophilum TaxID=1699371 RepID=A0A7D5GFU4_9EURY|nr:hypothetical protein [Natrinema halophilum]QLG47828.1 hypothetical protein HYG82_02690 [Natrinema halophilum]
MSDPDDSPGLESERIVEQDETYDHDEYGLVEVTGIWKGVEQIDATHNTDQKDKIIVRYSAEQDGGPVTELTDTFDEFLDAIE